MKTIINKSGNAFITIGIVRSKKLKNLIPKEARVYKIFPGFSFYAVGIFNYNNVSDLVPGNKKYSWDNCFDTCIQIPIDLYSTKKLFYIKRLYNSNQEVVRWAKGHSLYKIHSDVSFLEEKNKYNVVVKATGNRKEKISLSGRSFLRLPKFFWRFGLLKAISEAFMVSKFENEFYCFQSKLSFEKSYLDTGRSEVIGIDLPRPLLSLSLSIHNFRPLKIKTFFKLYHECEYIEQTKMELLV